MNLDDPHNKLSKQIAPGIWIDQAGALHYSISDLLKQHGLEDNEENKKRLCDMISKTMKKKNPNSKLLFREKPTDDGVDIR